MNCLKPLMLAVLVIPLPGTPVAAETLEERKQNITDEQLREFAAKREQYKDNPEAMKFIEAVQKELGITEDDIAHAQGKDVPGAEGETRGAETEPGRAAVDANPQLAEQAYNSGDYETAYEHYKALADQGDPYANLILGLMYQQGQGVEPDMSKAHAYYGRADDEGETRGRELIQTIEPTMSKEELEQAQENYKQLAEDEKE